ncbi:MAG: 3-phosphoshikimate 1-carboxyvinyltransferase [Flavobacteriaceae bacterium]|nr:3-phosphoshikimate 1-carboxyvinyltransferase [Flavobacteriaceae bacterium]
MLHLKHNTKPIQANLQLCGSKSLSNRYLILKDFLPQLKLENLSDSDDTTTLVRVLAQKTNNINVGPAGTAMRFLCARLACEAEKNYVLTGDQRMHQRPIAELVDTLNALGASISYIEKEHYPPLAITGQNLLGGSAKASAKLSSQYISALMLIAPFLTKGLKLILNEKPISEPYIWMTLNALQDLGIKAGYSYPEITIPPIAETLLQQPKSISIESDWSSASYWYSLIALGNIGDTISLSFFESPEKSSQGDAVVAKLYEAFGVQSHFTKGILQLEKCSMKQPTSFEYDFINCPDLAQTLAFTCFGLRVPFHAIGLKSLRIKETDRIAALETAAKALGVETSSTKSSFSAIEFTAAPSKTPSIKTFNDHRMAMAAAALAQKTDLIIQDVAVVSKSYPRFWDDFKILGLIP